MKNADMPAMPIPNGADGRPWTSHSLDNPTQVIGLTKREEFAKHFAAAYLTGCLASRGPTPSQDECADEAIAYADALLAKLGKTQ